MKRRVVNPARQRVRRRRGGRRTPSVTRLVDITGWVSFAGTPYKVGKQYSRRSVQVAVVDSLVEISLDGEVIQTHPIRHDRSKEHGALANPTGRPPRKRSTAA